MRYRNKKRSKSGLVVLAGLLLLMGSLLLYKPLYRALSREPIVFTQEDASKIQVRSECGCEVDTTELLLQELNWDLREDGPQVLILHTHATESYTQQTGEAYTQSDPYRTLEEEYNMLSVGARIAQILEGEGINVIHDTTLYDYPDYGSAYENARMAVEAYLEEYPTIQLVLDIHRDAVENYDGTQWAPTAVVDGETSAKLMLVIGTGCGKDADAIWQENMALAVKLHAQLETMYPGICREISLRSSKYNQDLSAGFLLAEVGTCGNTHTEAMLAAEALAQAILALSQGAVSGEE